jgi:SAM-dependent methyltransferase
MATETEMTLLQRLVALWGHLGLRRAHVGAQMPADIADLASQRSELLGGVVLSTPTRLGAAPFAGVAERLLLIAGDRGMSAAAAASAARSLRGAARVTLSNYDVRGWSDVVADRSGAIVDGILGFLSRCSADNPALPSCEGAHAGISYKVQGSGPALVLLPYYLAPTQWDAALPRLAQHFTVVTLGGPNIGGVALLEDRARAPSFRGMAQTLFDAMSPQPGERILDVGCGSGALDRLFARRYGSASPLTATDVNPFLLREAISLAIGERLDATIRFCEANAEALPFEDASFDCLFSVTVLEECDADQALAEMLRVVTPGGRVGVIVRANDLPQWWNLDLPEAIRRKADVPPPSASDRGIADASLYHRMRSAGFRELICFPSLVTLDNPEGPVWRFREDHTLSALSAEEAETWRVLAASARREDLLFMAHPMHCAVGTRPIERKPSPFTSCFA